VAATVVVVAARPSVAAAVGRFGLRLISRLPLVGGGASFPWSGESLARFWNETIGLLRKRWLALTLTTAVNQLTGWAILELALRAVGIGSAQVAVGESFAAWSVGRLLASLPLTPGGIGFVELGVTGTLVAFGGRSAQVVAGVLAGMVWALQHPHAGVVEPDDMDHEMVLAIAKPYLGQLVGVYGDWTPLQGRTRLFSEDVDQDDPWQFKNIRVT